MATNYKIGDVLWVLKLRESVRDEAMATSDWFYAENEPFSLTDDVNAADWYEDKDAEIESMKVHEAQMKEMYGERAICNYGYTNTMLNFEFVEVEVCGER